MVAQQLDGKGAAGKPVDDYSIEQLRLQLAQAKDKISQLQSDIVGYKNIQNEQGKALQ